MQKKYFSVDDVNRFLKSENKMKISGFVPMQIVDFVNMSFDVFEAILFITEHLAKSETHSTYIVTYKNFKEAMEQGEIDILQLSSRQMLYFLTFINEEDCQKKIRSALIKEETLLLKLQNYLPCIVNVMKNPTEYEKDIVQTINKMAKEYLTINRRVQNFRKYLKFIEFCG